MKTRFLAGSIWIQCIFFACLIFAFAGSAWAVSCPQHRNTEKAPPRIYGLKNPIKPDLENIMAGKKLFDRDARPLACRNCHGENGDGRGPMSFGLTPPPRNFTCARTIDGVPDGQLFWIIRNGSRGTGMPAFKNHLSEDQIWKLILYIRQLARTRVTSLSEERAMDNCFNAGLAGNRLVFR